MTAVHSGSWFGLPDFGVTEAIGSLLGQKPTYQGGSNLLGPQPQASYTPPAPQVLSASSSQPWTVAGPPAGYNSGGRGGNIPSTATNSNNSLNQGLSNIQGGQDAGNAQIEADYNQSMAMLGNAESGLRSQADAASAQLDTGAGAATNEINNSQATAEQGVNSSLQTAETGAKSATQQARDLFRQTQQSNNAQLSALGISSSSVAEALAERLGVETARRIGQVGDSLQTVRQNAVNELGRVKTYYQGQIQNLTQHVQDQKAQIQQSLIAGLNQINSARGQAANDKAAARANLLSQVQNQIYSLTAQQQQFQQSLDQWAAQKAAALTPIAQDPNYLNNLIATANTINAQPQFSQFGTAVPSVNVAANGTMTGQITTQKKTNDPYQQMLQQAGVNQ